MSALALGIILVAAFTHATWNYAAKRSGGGLPFVWLTGLVSLCFYGPLSLAYLWWQSPVIPPGAWLVVVGRWDGGWRATVNGADALEKLKSGPFDLVLMDVHIPVVDGRDAGAQIRASGEPWADVPIVALTADAMAGDREKFLAMGMDAYVAKPIEPRELFTAMNLALHSRRPSKAA
mgnify:CR=1 FL=1